MTDSFYLVIQMSTPAFDRGQQSELATTLESIAAAVRTAIPGQIKNPFIVRDSDGEACGTANIFPLPIIPDRGSGKTH